jgi:hypothetical protein
MSHSVGADAIKKHAQAVPYYQAQQVSNFAGVDNVVAVMEQDVKIGMVECAVMVYG